MRKISIETHQNACRVLLGLALLALPLAACTGDDAVYDDADTTSDTGETGDSGDDESGDGDGDGDSDSDCGNGEHEAGEECDDGEFNAPDASCTPSCTLNVCGDGFVGSDEDCDDENDVDADGCEADCTLPACGNGIIDPGEICYSDPLIHDYAKKFTEMALGDLDDDGNDDLVLVNADDDTLSVLLGAGDGNFVEGQTVQGEESTNALVLADMDDDGDLDLAAVSGQGFCSMIPCEPIPGRAALWHNDGNAAFGDASVVPVGDTNLGVTAGDFDGDERLDLAVGDVKGKAIHLLTGLADMPYLSLPQTTATTGAVGGVASGDVDGDEVLDVIGVGGKDATVLLGIGDGLFSESSVLDLGGGLVDPWLADANGDGHLDILTIDSKSTAAHVLENDGSGGFDQRGEAWAGWGPARMVVADLSQDGDLDFAVSNAQPNLATLGRGLGDGTFEEVPALEPWGGPWDIVAADFDHDGTMDLAISRPAAGAVTIFLADP